MVINYFVYYDGENITGVELYKQTQPGDFVSLQDEESNIDVELIISDYKVVADALVEMSQAEKDAKALPDLLDQERIWVAQELHECDIMARFFETGDTNRQVGLLADWHTWAIALRDYIDSEGNIDPAGRPTGKPTA
jgi:hypothetical protein